MARRCAGTLEMPFLSSDGAGFICGKGRGGRGARNHRLLSAPTATGDERDPTWPPPIRRHVGRLVNRKGREERERERGFNLVMSVMWLLLGSDGERRRLSAGSAPLISSPVP